MKLSENTIILKDGWRLKYVGESVKQLKNGTVIKATVPGDITVDLYNAGIVKDPYFGYNYKDLQWIGENDFEYETTFSVTEDFFANEEIELVFKGIDTYADVYVNGQFAFSAEDMFICYKQNVKHLLNVGKNTLKVYMKSTLRKMETINTEGYFGVFNTARLFVRKAQCHFGWDWAPKLAGYGIWDDVYLIAVNKHNIQSLNYETTSGGDLTVHTELSYSTVLMIDFDGYVIPDSAEEKKDDVLKYFVYDKNGKLILEESANVVGKKQFTNLKVENPELWWPSGYGQQPLYSLKVELWRDGKLVSDRKIRFAFRKIELEQKPTGTDTMGYCIKINGREIFVRGSNWVPIDCFTGTIKDEKYRRLITLAKDVNMNMLRVWGGGIYEKDIFYDICDELGIMVWQDFMFACSDIPEDDPAWENLTLRECEYQIKRLRTHPSVVYWCGGNEKTGTCVRQPSRGDKFVDYALQGLVLTFDTTRPYARQSPVGFTDVGNDNNSGDAHNNSFEPSIEKGIVNYRKTLNETVASFLSECAVMGPCSKQSFAKFTPQEYLWPMNDFWDDRLVDNPYAAIHMTFAKRQLLYIGDLYGQTTSFEDYVVKGMNVHNEAMRAEIDYARFHKGMTQGIMNWMYSDIWPTATWAIVDYYTEPKQAYYGMKKAYAPIRATFVEDKQGNQNLVLINDTLQALPYEVVYGSKTINGKIVKQEKITGVLQNDGAFKKIVENVGKKIYFFVEGKIGDIAVNEIYSVDFWRGYTFKNEYTYTAEKTAEDVIQVKFKADTFVRTVILSLPDNYKYTYSDNYFDMQAGEEKVVVITDTKGVNVDDLIVSDSVKEINK